MKNITTFTAPRAISKTLSFSAQPIEKTWENFNNKGLLDEDTQRAENYKLVKKLCDRYIKYLFEQHFADFKLKVKSTNDLDSIEEVQIYYLSRSKDLLEKTQLNLRMSISKIFQHEDFKRTLKKEIITEDLMRFLSDPVEILAVTRFSGFTTYFRSFFKNRENIYGDKGMHTEISNRVINENLLKFIDNSLVYARLKASPLHAELNGIFEPFKSIFKVDSIGEVFSLDNYSYFIVQNQIDAYNGLIGAITSEDKNNPVVGLNQRINEHNQQQKNKEEKLPKFKPLFKQILSDRVKNSFVPDAFDSVEELMDSITNSYQLISSKILPQLEMLLNSFTNYDLNKIYLDHGNISDISKRHFGTWSLIDDRLRDHYEATHPIKKKSIEAYEKNRDAYIKSLKFLSIGEINNLVAGNNDDDVNNPLEQYFTSKGAMNNEKIQRENYFALITNNYIDVQTLFSTLVPTLEAIKKKSAPIKEFLDNLLALVNFVKPLNCANEPIEKDEIFYSQFTPLFEELEAIAVPLYNKVRNYITQKPYSTDKIKINFRNVNLMNGWDVNKEDENASILAIKDGNYYLMIADKSHRNIFRELKECDENVDGYAKMEYKLLPGANKMFPKVFFAESLNKVFNPPAELLKKYKQGTHIKGDKFILKDCHALIDFFKESLNKHEDWSQFDFKFSDTSSYNCLSDFYHEVDSQGYKLTFKKIATKNIDNLVDEGKLYLFKLYSKDFSEYSKGLPNLHTIYWKMLFDPRNLDNVVYKLNGNGELFFRPQSMDINNTAIHPAGIPIENKNENIKSLRPTRTLPYDIIKNKRFTTHSFQVHIPITMNFKFPSKSQINDRAREFINSNGISHIIGIDRGERNLLSYAVIDLNGNIKEQGSLNEITTTGEYKTNYLKKLSSVMETKDKQRKNWTEISTIKDIKAGYLSQVVNKLVRMMLKYNAIISLESLSAGFMQSRQKIETSVYRNFEKALIDKLNYVVLKELIDTPKEPGGPLNAIQLTDDYLAFNKYQKGLIKQCGFLFFIPAWCTSKIDPVTGFVNMLDTRYETKEKAKAFFSKFTRISYDKTKDMFEFEFDYSKFHNRAHNSRSMWTVCSYGDRLINKRNADGYFVTEKITLTSEYKEIFAKNGIDISGNIKDAIMAQDDAQFFKSLLNMLRLTLQLRNSNSTTGEDYILSPVRDANGNFFDSQKGDTTLPTDADNNGSYNIARKGLLLMKQIMLAPDIKKLKLELSNQDWLRFAQNID